MKKFHLECIFLFLIVFITSCSEDNPIPEVFNEAPIIEVITQIDATENGSWDRFAYRGFIGIGID